MARVIVFLMTLMFVLQSDGSAQDVPSPGDRIRIRQVDGPELTGTLTTFSAETIQLSLDSESPTVEVPVAGIVALETSLGRRHNYGKYIAISVVAGSVVGAVVGASLQTCSGSGFCVGPESAGEGMAYGLLGGALLGLPLGALIGAVVTEEQWSRVALPAPTASRLTIRPVIGSRLGFGGSIRVGGF